VQEQQDLQETAGQAVGRAVGTAGQTAATAGRPGADELLTAAQVQHLFHVDRSTVYRMAEDGRLPAVKIGRQWRFPALPIRSLLGGIDAARTPAGPRTDAATTDAPSTDATTADSAGTRTAGKRTAGTRSASTGSAGTDTPPRAPSTGSGPPRCSS